MSMIPVNRKFLRGDIYYANLEPHLGSEQGGIRPVVVVQNNTANCYSPNLIVAPVTSNTAKKPDHQAHVLVDGNRAFLQPSMILAESVQTISKGRLIRPMGRLSIPELIRLNYALLYQLDLNEWVWFTKQGIEVWSVNEGQQRFDTHVDKLMNYIRYWQASGESLKTSVRTRTRLEQLTGEGHYTGGTVAFGYKRVRLGRVNKKNQEVCDLVIDEAEAEIVRLIFHKYVYEGYGAQKLSHYLYEQGVVGRNNKNIPNTSIVRMIKNKGYTGYLINGAVETECPQLRIIEPELFEQAQELRQARTCERGGTSLGTSSKALLTGLVYCGHCGNRLSLTSSGRTHTYADGHTVKEVRPRYSCFYKIRHLGDCDGQSGYGVSKLDSIVEEVVRQIFAQFREVSRKKLLESVKTNDAARIQKKVKKIQKDLEAKQKELDDLKAETILVIRGVSALDKELLGTLVAEARETLETLEKQLVQAQEEYEEATKTAKRSNYICNELFTWADVYDTANHDERRAILQQFITEIRVRKDYEISITLNASFNQVEQLKAVSSYDGAEIFEEISEKGA